MWKLTATASLTLACCGCDAKTQKAYREEFARVIYAQEYGPTIVASIVGASAPPGGPAVLNALWADQAWRMLFTKVAPDSEYVQSMFEVPNPNRPVKITITSRIRHVTADGQ